MWVVGYSIFERSVSSRPSMSAINRRWRRKFSASGAVRLVQALTRRFGTCTKKFCSIFRRTISGEGDRKLITVWYSYSLNNNIRFRSSHGHSASMEESIIPLPPSLCSIPKYEMHFYVVYSLSEPCSLLENKL